MPQTKQTTQTTKNPPTPKKSLRQQMEEKAEVHKKQIVALEEKMLALKGLSYTERYYGARQIIKESELDETEKQTILAKLEMNHIMIQRAAKIVDDN